MHAHLEIHDLQLVLKKLLEADEKRCFPHQRVCRVLYRPCDPTLLAQLDDLAHQLIDLIRRHHSIPLPMQSFHFIQARKPIWKLVRSQRLWLRSAIILLPAYLPRSGCSQTTINANNNWLATYVRVGVNIFWEVEKQPYNY